ncbi:NAD(P)-binding protein [Hyaloscypha variabilis F]|uniref:NAD(P)-binding protein n=1 Tax=Hyaloscypha variabilis (strain UAMH 11265 / GT02V1 / F) TaxID=1149755 RepID=A0A2J6RNA3_HYAVF|nr:NAD(P)-binding protein [Hyaloscypha variabilis F]
MAPAIPLDSVVLVTGVNGFIGSHIADQFLQAGYKVRGTVRKASKADGLKALWEKKYGPGQFEVVEVPEMAVKGAFDEAVKGVSGICHAAYNLSWTPDPNVLIPEVHTTITELLRSAAAEPSVKRFIYTSSISACWTAVPNEEIKIDENTWDEESIKKAWAPPPYTLERSHIVYSAGKVMSEQTVWKFVKEQRPNFVVNSILPNMNWGAVLDPSQPASTSSQGSSSNFIPMLYLGDPQFAQMFPPQYYINVKDDARLHVAALTFEDVANERIFAMADKFTWNEVMRVLRKLRPDHKFIEDFTDEKDRDLSTVPNQRGAELLKRMGRPGYTSLEETLADNISAL